MPPITVRLSDKEKKSLQRYGKISDVVRDALQMYIDKKKKEGALKKLEELQRENKLETSIDEIVASIRKDRRSD
jgi:Arc/MetJ-type ribon-helix-helix transcriptional regulator